ncbi:MAG: secretin N-terminal domain-containing protein [Phycisphaerales bacterium]
MTMGRRTPKNTAASLLRRVGAAAAIGSAAVGLAIATPTATGQTRDRNQNGRESGTQSGSPREALEQRDREQRLIEIQNLKETLQSIREGFAERGVPTEDQIRLFEERLQDLMLESGLDPATEMAEMGGFMFIEPRPLGPRPLGRPGAGAQPGVLGPGNNLELEGGGDGVGQLAQGDPNAPVELNFAAPVNLSEFARFVARALSVNIFADPSLETQVIEFMAPVQVPRESLLDLLAALVEERGFVLLKDRLGFYKIDVAGNIPPGFGDERATSRMIPTPLVRPSQVVPLVQSLFGTNAQQTLTLTALDDLGVLVVSGPPRVLDSVEDAVNRFVAKQVGQEYFTFPLERVSAEFARDRLLVLSGESADAGGTTRGGATAAGAATRQGGAGGGAVAGSLSNLGGRLIVGAGNSLVFRGEPSEAALIEALLSTVDMVTRLRARRYSAGSVAEQAAIAASELGLGPVSYADQIGAGGTGTFGANTRGGSSFNRTRTGLFGSGLDDSTAQISGSKSVVDLQNGTIVYYGTDSQHEIFREIVDQFVEDAVQDETVILTYKLDNATSTEVAALLNDLITDPDQALAASPLFPGQGRAGGAAELLPPTPQGEDAADQPAGAEVLVGGDGLGIGLVVNPDETRIIDDPDRNQIIIRAKPEAQRQFARLIEQLDQRQPQVQLNVQIVSVTDGDSFEWAAALSGDIGDFFGDSGFSLPGGIRQITTNGVAGSGLVAGVISSDVLTMVINTLQTTESARIVSNPSIVVNDNQTADLQSTEEQPFSSTSQGGNSTITSQGGTAEAGTILTVTPQISSGGYINLEYSIELSSFTGIAQDGLQPPRQTENYTSFVTLPSDATLIVGGFRRTDSRDTEQKVPILGDIPIIGNAFKSRTVEQRMRTIFVFITPRILDNPRFADLRLITEGPSKAAEITVDVPPLESVRIPIRTSTGRLLPQNRVMQQNLLQENIMDDDAMR